MRTYTKRMCKNALILAFQLAFDVFCFYRSLSKWSSYLQMNVQNSITKNNKSLFFLLLLPIPCGYFFRMHALYKKCAYLNWVFVFGRMTYDATFSKHSATTTIIMKQKAELLAEQFAFVFIELTLFEVIHMNLLVMQARSLSLSHTLNWDFFKNSFLHFIE